MIHLTVYMLNAVLACQIDEHELARVEDYLREGLEYFKVKDNLTGNTYIVNKRTYLYMELK